jgi:hypothetical protein
MQIHVCERYIEYGVLVSLRVRESYMLLLFGDAVEWWWWWWWWWSDDGISKLKCQVGLIWSVSLWPGR